MFKAMAMKELRELRGIALLALAAYAMLVVVDYLMTTRWHPETIPFIGDGFFVFYCWITPVVAVVLGLRQTLGESIGGTYLLLFHRPATRTWLIGVKFCVGLSLFLLCGAAPIALYGLLMSVPGLHASPLLWAASTPDWLALWALTALFFGAFLTGIRPGRWFGSRLLPLAGATLAVLIAHSVYTSLGSVALVVFTVFVDAWLIAAIVWVEQVRDYP